MKPLILLLLVVGTSAQAEPITLKCKTDTGEKAADLVVDFASNQLRWGPSTYTIFHKNDQYISAYEVPGNRVGGEVWVLDRVTGEYTRAAVLIFTDSEGRGAKLRPGTFKGHCNTPML